MTQSIDLTEFRAEVIAHFGNDDWLYIKHPLLDYRCPIKYAQEMASLKVVRELLEIDKMF